MQCRGAKSFVDDLGLSRGVVISRAAALLRSIETKPFDSKICPLWTDSSSAWIARLVLLYPPPDSSAGPALAAGSVEESGFFFVPHQSVEVLHRLAGSNAWRLAAFRPATIGGSSPFLLDNHAVRRTPPGGRSVRVQAAGATGPILFYIIWQHVPSLVGSRTWRAHAF